MYCLLNKSIPGIKWIKWKMWIMLLFMINDPCLAQSDSQSAETIDIKAQYLLLDESKGLSLYKGDVLFTKATLTIKADRITLYHKDKKLIKALIQGSPADVQHLPDNEAAVHSQAKKMEYFVTEERLELIGNAFVDQGNRHFSGEHISYDTRQGTLTAGVKKNNPLNTNNAINIRPAERVHVIIGPVEDKKNSENNRKKVKP